MSVNLWSSSDHAREYLDQRADNVPHRRQGESAILEYLPDPLPRVLDLGTGDGRLLAFVKSSRRVHEAVAIDFSPLMLERSRLRWADDPSVTLLAHDMEQPLPELGRFAAVISSFAIHHLSDDRKRRLYAEIFKMLAPGGVFCNLEHVASPTPTLHADFLRFLDQTPEQEDPSNKLVALETQLAWLRGIGFADVDCGWKWRELALMVATVPDEPIISAGIRAPGQSPSAIPDLA